MIEDKEKKDLQLEKEIEEQSNLLRTERMDVSFGELMSMYQQNEVIIHPAFQRYFRWDEYQMTRFIESIILGIPIPAIFVATNGDGEWEVVDGLQRLSTVFSFVGILKDGDKGLDKKNDWQLMEGDRVIGLEGYTYRDLPQKFKYALKRAVCRVEILKWNSSYDMRYELFNRLNTGGTPLSPQEIRNCIFRDISSDFNDFLFELSENEDFISALSLSVEQRESLYDQELILRFMSLYDARKIKTSVSQYMTKFMENALKNKNFDYDRYRILFNRLFAILKTIGPSVFRRSNGAFATSLYDVIIYGIGHNLDKYENMSSDDIIAIIHKDLVNDANFLKLSRKGGNNQRERIMNRLALAKTIFGK